MRSVNILQAKSALSRLVKAIEQGEEREIVIARNGRPAVRLVPMDTVPAGKRGGQHRKYAISGSRMPRRNCAPRVRRAMTDALLTDPPLWRAA